ncbi:MAG TPA: family 1 glycosylhydrolase [Actinomycetota bacterium]|nr:family 1 glycosylhydrolase [Actinomycetota bacterium]
MPGSFLWGAATAAHQVEGGNWNSDWWAWEHDAASPCAEPSGDACDHLNRYAADLALLADLGFDAYRFSVEWARVEPEPDEFSRAALGHYRRVIDACRELDLLPVVTLHHFTSPRWVAARGSWAHAATADRFARFSERVARDLGDGIAMVCTINEPNVVADHGYGGREFAPGFGDEGARERAVEAFVAAHGKARAAVKSRVDVPVGMTLAMTDYQEVDGGGPVLERLRRRTEDVFLEAARGDDFIGVQTYTRARIGPEGPLEPEEGVETTAMGYEFWPEAIGATIARAAEVCGAPVVVTENGIATDDDDRRIAYVERALRAVGRCIEDGIEVRGYFHWSLLDNFEWAHGYAPRFGLVSVDRTTFARAPKPSARWLGERARAGGPPAGRIVDD